MRSLDCDLGRDPTRQGELFVAVTDEGTIAGTLTLLWSDPIFWGERDDAGYVHRLAVRRSHAGIGRPLLDWADAVVGKRRAYLCVDVMSENVRLRRYYERLGFHRVREISGPASHPHGATDTPWTATLYERRCQGLAEDQR